ncbi:hypothetical protein [Enterobacter hormaechei]|nr:hypothetical protein [Enterobacter hormaechei]
MLRADGLDERLRRLHAVGMRQQRDKAAFFDFLNKGDRLGRYQPAFHQASFKSRVMFSMLFS